MAREFSVEFLSRDFEEATRHYPDRLWRNMRVAYRRSMGRFRATFIRRSPVLDDSQARVGSPSASAAKGSRGLANTFRWVVSGQGNVDQLRARFWTESFAAVGLETGRGYTPRRGKYLAIPIGFALGAGGRPKRAYRSMEARVKARGGWSAFRRIPAKNGSHIVWEGVERGRTRKDGTRARKWKPVYLLTPRAKPRTRLGMFSEWNRFQPRVLFRVREAIEATLEGRRLS